jgi:hypothetical protein
MNAVTFSGLAANGSAILGMSGPERLLTPDVSSLPPRVDIAAFVRTLFLC